MKACGEDMQVNNLITNITFTGAGVATEGINNLAIYVNGSQVGSSQNFVESATPKLPALGVVDAGTNLAGTATFGTNNMFTIQAGTTDVVEIRGDLSEVSGTTQGSVKADLALNALKAQGVSSVTSFPATTITTVSNQTLSIVAANLTVAANTGFGSQNVVQNTAKQKIGSFILQTGSAEGVRVTNLNVAIGGGIATDLTRLTNLYISENTTPVLPQSSNNFPVNFTMPINNTRTIDVFADLGTIANGVTVTTTLTVTGLGASSNGPISQAQNGQTLTIQTGSLATPTLVSNDPNPKLLLSGSTQQIADFKFVAANGTANISELWFHNTVAGTSTAAISTSTASVTVAGVTAPFVFDGVNQTAHLTGLNIAVPAGTQGLQVPVTATMNTVTSAGSGGIATDAHVAILLTDYKYSIGSATRQATVNDGFTANSDVASNVFKLDAAIPVINLAADNPAGMSTGYTGSGSSELMRFTVTNGSGNAINLHTVSFMPVYSTTTLTATTQQINIYDKNDLSTILGHANIGTSGSLAPVSFGSDQIINANATREFVVKVDTTGTWGTSGQNIRLDLTSNSLDLLGSGTNFQWNDSTINTYVNSYLVQNLPLTGNTFVR